MYIDPFDYTFYIITKINLFKDYIDIRHVDEVSLKFVIHYSRSQWKKKNLLIDVSYMKYNMKGLKLIARIVIYLRRIKKMDSGA